MKTIPYGHQWLDNNDITEVVKVLKSGWLTQGPKILEFEKCLCKYTGAKYAVAVSSGTAALHIACLAAGLKSGDWLWTSPNTFVASANCALYCGAKPDFVDIDPRTYNLSPASLETKLRQSVKTRKLPKIVIPVHFTGQSCEMEQIHSLSQKYGFHIIEDACHSLGGSYRKDRIGSCRFSDMTVFSFHPVKTITTGEGGMVLTNRKDLYDKLMCLRNHGITRDESLMEHESPGPWYYEQIALGFNYRITDLQAALGISQMNKVDKFVKRRQKLAQRYDKTLSKLPVTLPWQHPDTRSAYHLYVIRLKLKKITETTHRRLFEKLRNAGIGVNLHYIPVHTQPYYQKLGFKWGGLPQAEQYYREAITLPLYYGLTEKEQNYVINILKTILS